MRDYETSAKSRIRELKPPRSRHILIVEDEPSAAEFVTGLLGEDYIVEIALGPVQGLGLAVATAPDLILIDSMLQGLAVKTPYAQLRARELRVHALVFSRFPHQRGEAGADSLPTLPSSVEELLRTVHLLLAP